MKSLDKTKFLKRVIIVSWIALICCFIIKIFGGNIFEIACNNENFIAICNYVDNHMWADWLFCGTFNLLNMYFAVLAMCGKYKYKKYELIVLICTIYLVTFAKVINAEMGVILDVWQIIIMPCVFTLKTPKRHWYVLLGNVFIVAFQLISMVIRNLSFGFTTQDGTLIGIIHGIDVIIMAILYYLYVNFKEERRLKNE